MMTPEDCNRFLDWRYATKEFDPSRKISPEVWESLKKSFVAAPSSFGMQLWQFIEVRDAAIRRELKAVSWDQDQVVDASHYVVVGVRRDVSEDDSDRHIRRMCEVRGLAPESLQAYKKKFKEFYGSKDSVEAVSWVDRQSYIALGFAMFAAAGLGVDTCAIEGISDTKEYDRILGLEGTPYRAICGLAFGYRNPADRYASIPKVRYKEEDVYRVI